MKQMPGTIKPSQHSAKKAWPIWGADGMIEMGLGIVGRRTPSLNVSGALYEEQFGRERTLIMQSTRDLSIMKVGLQTFSDRRATLTLLPISLFSRSAFMGIRQLGQRFHSDIVLGERGEPINRMGTKCSAIKLVARARQYFAGRSRCRSMVLARSSAIPFCPFFERVAADAFSFRQG